MEFKALVTAAALMNCGLAPIMLTIFKQNSYVPE
jgi:hypothetical protein